MVLNAPATVVFSNIRALKRGGSKGTILMPIGSWGAGKLACGQPDETGFSVKTADELVAFSKEALAEGTGRRLLDSPGILDVDFEGDDDIFLYMEMGAEEQLTRWSLYKASRPVTTADGMVQLERRC